METLLKRSLGESTEKMDADGTVETTSDLNLLQVDGLSKLDFWRSRHYGDISVSSIGKGTFSSVFKVTGSKIIGEESGSTKTNYALKRFVEHRDGSEISVFALREIAIMRALDHPAILRVLDVCDFSVSGHAGMGMLVELAPMSLEEQATQLTKGMIQIDRNLRNASYLAQLTSAVHYLHSNGICHRDLKPGNILCFKNYQVKLCDFGSARTQFIEGGEATNEVQTLFWRAPELALGVKLYGMEVDVYSLGIIFGELYLGYCPIWLDHNTVTELLSLQFRLLEGMTLQDWPSMTSLPYFDLNYLQRRGWMPPRTWKAIFARATSPKSPPLADDSMIMLLEGMTYGNPQRRLKINDVLAVLKGRAETRIEIDRLQESIPHPLLVDRSSKYQLPNDSDRQDERLRIDKLLQPAYDLLLWLCIETERPGIFCYAKELIRRHATLSGYPADDENSMRALAAAALIITSKLHDVISLDAETALDSLLDYPQEIKSKTEASNTGISVDDVRRAERTILVELEFDIIYPAQTEIEEKYIKNAFDFVEIPFGDEPMHYFHSQLYCYEDFIIITRAFIHVVGVLGGDSFDLGDLTRLSMYAGLKIFNRRITAVFSGSEIERIRQLWDRYSKALLRDIDLTGCNRILSSPKVAMALRAAGQINLFTTSV